MIHLRGGGIGCVEGDSPLFKMYLVFFLVCLRVEARQTSGSDSIVRVKKQNGGGLQTQSLNVGRATGQFSA